MKTLLFFLCFALSLAASEYRVWTNLSGKEIEARIIAKKPDDSAANLSMKDGKSYWVNAVDLIQADRDFIAAWKKKPLGFEHLTVEMTGNPGKGLKTLKVVVSAWNKPLILTMTSNHPNRKKPTTHQIPAHESVTLEFETGNNYRALLVDESGKVVSDQTPTNKD